MRKLIESLGFQLVGQCMCGGTFTQSFGRHPKFTGIKIKIFPNKKKFALLKDNAVVKSGKQEALIQILTDNGIIKPTPTPTNETITEVKEEAQSEAGEQIVPEAGRNN